MPRACVPQCTSLAADENFSVKHTLAFIRANFGLKHLKFRCYGSLSELVVISGLGCSFVMRWRRHPQPEPKALRRSPCTGAGLWSQIQDIDCAAAQEMMGAPL